jgi:hypothetical protein
MLDAPWKRWLAFVLLVVLLVKAPEAMAGAVKGLVGLAEQAGNSLAVFFNSLGAGS